MFKFRTVIRLLSLNYILWGITLIKTDVSAVVAAHKSVRECDGPSYNATSQKKSSRQRITSHLKILEKELGLIERADPVADLQKALQKGDKRFVGYYGVTLEVPGVTGGQRNSFVQRNGVRVLKGSSDVITMQLTRRLQKVSRNYMTPYNKSLLRHLQNQGR